MGSVGAERMRVMREGAPADVQGRQVSGLALRDGGGDEEREGEMDPGCTEEEDLAGLGYPALGSEGAGGAGVTQSFWFGQMGGRWHHLLL